MEQHRRKLDDKDKSEKKHKHETNRLKLKIFFTDVYLSLIFEEDNIKSQELKLVYG